MKQQCDCTLNKHAVNSFKRRIKQSGLEEQLRTKTFKNFITDTKTQKQMLKLCQDFVNEPKGMLALLGGTGSGKTHLGTATVGNLVYKGYSAYYIEWRSEWQRAQNNYQSIDEELMDKWVEADVLYIDDLFKNRNNDINAVGDKEFNHGWELLDRRLKRNKITIISSEFTVNDFMKIDQSTAGRLIEMAGDNMINIEASKENNYRLRKVVK